MNGPRPLSLGLNARLSLMMFLQYAIWGAWLPFFFPFLPEYRGLKPEDARMLFSIGAIGALADTVRRRVLLSSAVPGTGAPGAAILGYLACAIANAVNFMRVHRVVLAGPLASRARFADALRESVRRELFPALSSLVRFERWEEAASDMTSSAACLAIATVLDPLWCHGAQVE